MENFILAHKISAFMKNLLVFLFLIVGVAVGQTQNATTETQEWNTSYDLTTEQLAEVTTIVARKYRNLAELESLKTQDALLYKRKYQGIMKQTKVQVRRLLNTEQVIAFDAKETARKATIRSEAKAMMASGVNKEEISKHLEQLNY